MLAFEHLHHKDKLTQLGALAADDVEATVKLFSEIDQVEASWYYQIAAGRLGMIRRLKAITDEDALEKVIREYIYRHLWLLDPSWDRATETPSMARAVQAEFARLSSGLSEEERNGRIDIRYKKTAGKHVIVELKRASVRSTSWSLGAQVQKYMDALAKQLDEHEEEGPIEAVCLLGHVPTDWASADREWRPSRELAFFTAGVRVMTYQDLIKDAEASYDEYLRRAEDQGRIKTILCAVEDFG